MAQIVAKADQPDGSYNTGLFGVFMQDGRKMFTIGLPNGEITEVTEDVYNSDYKGKL